MVKRILLWLVILVLAFGVGALAMGEGEVKEKVVEEEMVTEASASAEEVFMIDDYDSAEVNLLGSKNGAFQREPSKATLKWSAADRYGETGRALKIWYNKGQEGWCGYYTLLKKEEKYLDASGYESIVFMIRGAEGGEEFELGLADRKWDKKGDSLKAGSINDYLEDGVTTEWQKAIIPLVDFGSLDFTRLASFVINCNVPGDGIIFIDNLALSKELPPKTEKQPDVVIIDDFDDSNLYKNSLKNRNGFFRRAPSDGGMHLVARDKGRAVELTYDKKEEGWCGFYALMKKEDRYFDGYRYKTISFVVKGAQGGETFELGLADRKWDRKGDSLKAPLSLYLKGGVTKSWKKVVIPLRDFGRLDYSELASFAINFNDVGRGKIYIDDIALNK